MPGRAFFGMRGTGDWIANQRPQSWREGILYLYPNGMAPLTGITSMLKSEKVTDPQFHWWTKNLPTQAATITGLTTDAALAAPYAGGGVAGEVLWAVMAADDAQQFKPGHQVLFRLATNYDLDTVGKVLTRVVNGAASNVSIQLLEDDDNGVADDLSDATRLLIVGSMHAEGVGMPDAISYNPVRVDNFTQIFRTSLEITRTARLTSLRTGDAYKEAKREALELHSIEMEKALIWGIPTENIAANGQPERSTRGLINVIRQFAPGNIDDYRTNPAYGGAGVAVPWLTGGEDWLDEQLEVMFRFGRRDKLALVGSGAMLQLNRLIKNGGAARYEFTPSTKSYGIKVVEWVTPFGTINMMTHPLFSYEPTNRNSMIILEPENLKFRYITDTTFYGDGEQQNTGPTRVDATKEEFLTEGGMEFHYPNGFGYLNGFGG